MHCPAEGNPHPEVEWHLMSPKPSAPTTGIGALIARGEVFEREKIYESDFGGYVCVARAPGFPAVSKKIILAKKCKQIVQCTGNLNMVKIIIPYISNDCFRKVIHINISPIITNSSLTSYEAIRSTNHG